MLRLLVHYGIHLLVPIVIALLFYRKNKYGAMLILLAGILIDIDHLLADPIFDPERCSIGFHPLHGYWAIAIYLAFLLFKKTRIFGIALLIHILADLVDCFLIGTQFK